MKYRKYIMLLLIIITSYNLKSQIINEYGFKIAYTRSTINPKEKPYETTWRPGINLAFFAEKNIYKILHTVVQIEYNSRGYKIESIETNDIGEEIQVVWANTRLDYISAPFFLKIGNNNSKYKPFIQFGPRLDYLFNFKKGVYKYSWVQVSDEFPSLLLLNSFSFGSSLSFGFHLPIKYLEKISIEARYNNGFADLRSKPKYRDNLFFGKSVSYDFWVGFTF